MSAFSQDIANLDAGVERVALQVSKDLADLEAAASRLRDRLDAEGDPEDEAALDSLDEKIAAIMSSK